MSVELLYTSAPQGLKQGSRGFSTVLCTNGLPINLATRLEGLSGYRHVFPPNHAQASSNPVCYSHLRFVVGGKSISILSRISDYGIDYSQRTNKLAHHIALDTAEQPAAGPAWLLSQPGFMRSAWDGSCKTLPAGPSIPQADQAPSICHTWQSVTGDAGWGGVIADAFMSNNPKPTWIVFKLEQSGLLLKLLNEAIALLPPHERWRATFSTYVTNLPPEVDCKVRCVLEGNDEARQAAARGQVIALSCSELPVSETSLVAMARGRSLQLESGNLVRDRSVFDASAGALDVTIADAQAESSDSHLTLIPPPPKAQKPVAPPQVSAKPPIAKSNSYTDSGHRRLVVLSLSAFAFVVVLLPIAYWAVLLLPQKDGLKVSANPHDLNADGGEIAQGTVNLVEPPTIDSSNIGDQNNRQLPPDEAILQTKPGEGVGNGPGESKANESSSDRPKEDAKPEIKDATPIVEEITSSNEPTGQPSPSEESKEHEVFSVNIEKLLNDQFEATGDVRVSNQYTKLYIRESVDSEWPKPMNEGEGKGVISAWKLANGTIQLTIATSDEMLVDQDLKDVVSKLRAFAAVVKNKKKVFLESVIVFENLRKQVIIPENHTRSEGWRKTIKNRVMQQLQTPEDRHLYEALKGVGESEALTRNRELIKDLKAYFENDPAGKDDIQTRASVDTLSNALETAANNAKSLYVEISRVSDLPTLEIKGLIGVGKSKGVMSKMNNSPEVIVDSRVKFSAPER